MTLETDEYIGPQRQLPQRISSSEDTSDTYETINTWIQGITTAFNVIGDAFVKATAVLVDGFEDAFRANAIHPDGPVIQGTAFPLPDDATPFPLVSEEARSLNGNENSDRVP
jgi:hypothetical protein